MHDVFDNVVRILIAAHVREDDDVARLVSAGVSDDHVRIAYDFLSGMRIRDLAKWMERIGEDGVGYYQHRFQAGTAFGMEPVHEERTKAASWFGGGKETSKILMGYGSVGNFAGCFFAKEMIFDKKLLRTYYDKERAIHCYVPDADDLVRWTMDRLDLSDDEYDRVAAAKSKDEAVSLLREIADTRCARPADGVESSPTKEE